MTSPAPQTILLVEDEDDDVVFMRMALEKTGIAGGLHVAADGRQAIDYLAGTGAFADRTHHPRPVLVFLDLKLPRVMGMDVLRWIRERAEFDLMTVIVLTSSQQASDVREACALKANSYLVKPSNPGELGEIAALVKRYWLGLNHPTATLVALDRSSRPGGRRE